MSGIWKNVTGLLKPGDYGAKRVIEIGKCHKLQRDAEVMHICNGAKILGRTTEVQPGIQELHKTFWPIL